MAILGTVLTARGNAQSSTHAVMNVSVTVVKANQAKVPSAVQFQFSDRNEENKINELGSFIISDKSITDGYLKFPDKVVLYNEKGEEIQFSVEAGRKTQDKKNSYSIKAISFDKASVSGNYRGNYKVSMIYQ